MLYWNGNVLKSVCSAEKKCIYIYTFSFFFCISGSTQHEKIQNEAKTSMRENIQQLKCLGKHVKSFLKSYNKQLQIHSLC